MEHDPVFAPSSGADKPGPPDRSFRRLIELMYDQTRISELSDNLDWIKLIL